MLSFSATAPTPAATSAAAPAFSLPALGAPSASTAAPATAPATPSPFGALATPASTAPATTTAAALAFGAFGAPAATTAAATTSLFGAPATTTAAPASSLFGATITTAPATTAAPALGGFGALTATTTTAATAAPSPFGAPAVSAPAAAPSVFGGLTTATTTAASAAQPPQPLTLKTKYADMTADQQKALTEIGMLIHDQIHMADQLQSQEVGEFIDTLTDDVSRLRKCYGNIATMLDRDMAAIQTLRSSVRTELNRVEVAGRILDAVKKGTTAEIAYNRTYSIVRYFTEKEGEFRTRAAEYAQRLAEIEDHVASLARSQPPSPQAVAETIRAQNNSFLLLASQVAALHNQVEKLRDQYLVYRRQYHGDGKNPFGKAGKKKKRASSVVAAEDAEFSYKEYANQFVEPTSVTVVAAAPAAAPAAAAAAPAASMFGGSIFGTPKPATTAATTAAPAPAFGASFGTSTFGQPESNKRQATGGLFGSTPTPAPAPAAPATGGFGGFSFGPK